MLPSDQAKASVDLLRELLAPQDDQRRTAYTILRHVSKSGMTREISVVIAEGGRVRDITWHVANVTAYRQGTRAGLKVSGCGMDMGFAVVYDLGRALWPNGTDEPHGFRNGELDRDGGYAIRQSWL